MTIEFAFMAFGGILLTTGITGGKFRLMEFRIGSIGPIARIISFLVGFFFIFIGLGLSPMVEQDPTYPEETYEAPVEQDPTYPEETY